MREKDDLSWYARKADGLHRTICAGRPPEDPERPGRVAGLLEELRAVGIKGSIERRTLYTRRLPPGCRGCLGGKGTNLYVTGLCTRDCFFCFNTKPRSDEIVVHGIKVTDPGRAGEIIKRYGLRSVGISGGEPLLFPERVLKIIASLRRLPFRVRIDLYTNGDRADEKVLRRLKNAGLDAMRFNLVANRYDTAPVARALRYFEEVAVEIPVVPDEMDRLKAMLLALDRLGVPFLNIHELFICRENDERVDDRGFAAGGEEPGALLWKPVDAGDEAALTLLLFALKNTKKLSVYYCSCRTQQMISERGLARRERIR